MFRTTLLMVSGLAVLGCVFMAIAILGKAGQFPIEAYVLGAGMFMFASIECSDDERLGSFYISQKSATALSFVFIGAFVLSLLGGVVYIMTTHFLLT